MRLTDQQIRDTVVRMAQDGVNQPPIPIGARVHVSDLDYTGVAIVLEYNPDDPGDSGPYYCHLIDLCDHELCEDDDDCVGEACRGWYAINPEGLE